MSHLTPAEIHDHVYGFRKSPHAESCPECRLAAEAVEAERDALRDALGGEHPEAPYELVVKLSVRKPQAAGTAPRAAVSVAGLAAAAAFLAGLAWLLFYKPSEDKIPGPADSGKTARKDDIDRLIGELKSSSPLRREIAEAALKAYGETAADRLEKAKADPALIDACRGLGPADHKVMKSLRENKVTLDMAKVPLTAAIEYLREITNLNFVIDTKDFFSRPEISISVTNISAADALDQICRQLEYGWTVRDETAVIVQRKPTVPSRAPVRVLARTDAERWAAALENPLKERHDEAAAVLRDLGFAAEPALWRLLDSADTGARDRAAELLRKLYTPYGPPDADGLKEKLRTAKISLDLADAPLTVALEYIGEVTGINFAIDGGAIESPEDHRINAKVKDLAVGNTLKFLLDPWQRIHVVIQDLVLITKQGRVRETPRRPVWMEPEKARKMELLMDALSSPDEVRHRKAADELAEIGEEALGPLLQGYRLFDGAAAARCSAVRRRIAARMGVWLTDEPSGADVQRLTAAQRDIISRKVNLKFSNRSLQETFKDLEVPFELRANYPWKVAFAAKDLRLASFLRTATRPHGLDFYLAGDKVVIDTAERVRQAVEK